MFALVAVLTTVSNVSSLTVTLVCAGNVGATFASLTITVKVFVLASCGLTKSNGLPFVTTVVMRFVPGLCVCAGVQVMVPLALMLMPVGGLIKP